MNSLIETLRPDDPLSLDFDASLKETGLYPLTAEGISVFQINLGYRCNLACRHCHVEAGPARTEVMSREVLDMCLRAIEASGEAAGKAAKLPAVDLTGGAPEMHPEYRWFVEKARDMGCHVKTRTNLTILMEKGFEDLPGFFAKNRVEVIASLPYYLEETADRQRGKGVFCASIEAIKRLNREGYGVDGGAPLNLVYNPCGAFLPPAQKSIETDFKRELKNRHGISFTNLFTITNMPIGRFLKFLKDSGNLSRYMEKLRASYNPCAAANVMCRQMISVGWDGSLYDCDFNQMLGLKRSAPHSGHIKDYSAERLRNRKITTGAHCYGCTAGAGSSCAGAVA